VRRAALLAALLTLAACGDDATPASPRTDVRVTFDRDGPDGRAARTVRVRCPSRRHAPACRRLARLPAAAFRPVPRTVVCAEVYGGPQTGRIAGVVRGRRVNARYSRTNGCEIARYDRVRPVLAAAR
jgi:hypothetical protein